MRRLFLLCVSGVTAALAQNPGGITLPHPGGNQRNSASVTIGLVKASVDYSSPAVHGPAGKDRRGHIWGELVPNGMVDLGFNGGKLSPWRAGANENTVFSVSHEVTIGDKAAGGGELWRTHDSGERRVDHCAFPGIDRVGEFLLRPGEGCNAVYGEAAQA